MTTENAVKTVLNDTLQLGGRAFRMQPDTPLLGNLPELDSMAILNLITALEEHFGFNIADDEISADAFATLGSLTRFVEHKQTL